MERDDAAEEHRNEESLLRPSREQRDRATQRDEGEKQRQRRRRKKRVERKIAKEWSKWKRKWMRKRKK